jgi:hypothetical protein
MPQQTTQVPFKSLAAPEGSSAEYREGWQAAEEWIRHGGPVTSQDLHPNVMPGGMTEEQSAGFRSRILKALDPENGKVLTLRPRATRA